jgi:ABC-type uncharacterized transport system involved in gliding motility auxiliary subunit
MNNQRFINLSAIVLAAVLFFAINIISDSMLGGSRIDLTERKLFTLSDGTRELLGELKEPVTLKLYYSRSLAANAPEVRNHAENVINMLEEYASVADGNVRLEIIDPEPFSEAEDRAVDSGLSGVPIGQGGENFYFGVVGTNMTDDQESIGFFSPERARFLEYDLTRTIYGLSNPNRPVLTVISGFPLEWGPGGVQAAMRGQSRPYGIMQPMQEFFDVRVLSNKFTEIDPDTDVLLLLHARDLTEPQMYAIDQFIVKNGKALVFADPFSETGVNLPPPSGVPSPLDRHESVLPPLFKAWGVEVERDRIVADRGFATRVNAGGGRRTVIDYVGWISPNLEALNSDDVITAELQRGMLLPSAGRIRQIEGGTLSVRPLVLSSNDAQLLDAGKFRRRPDPQGLLADFQPDDEQYVLAARLHGQISSAFQAAPEGVESEHVAQSTGPIDVILVADADLLDDRYWLSRQAMGAQEVTQPISGNGDFLINALDNLAGSADLITLRSRAEANRPFQHIEELRRAAEQRFLAEEQALVEKLSATEQKLADLQSKAGEGSRDLLSGEEQKAIDEFQEEMLQTRRDLRAVQHNLRSEIDALQSEIQVMNIALMPAFVLVISMGVGLVRRRRRIASQRTKEA